MVYNIHLAYANVVTAIFHKYRSTALPQQGDFLEIFGEDPTKTKHVEVIRRILPTHTNSNRVNDYIYCTVKDI